MSDTESTPDRPGAVRHDDRLSIPIAVLTDAEVDAMTTSVIEGGEPYELDDIDEDGTMLGGKRGPNR